jgi:hypothetical protein
MIIFLKNSLMITLTLILFCLPKYSSAQVNNNGIISKSDSKQANSRKELPGYKETGNKEEDVKNYEKAKENFKASQTKKIIPPKVPKNNLSNSADQKPHYILSLNSSAKQKEEMYISALNQFARIENFRLIDKRRIIQLANGDGNIELFSSNELNQLYGRRIRPQNLKDESAQPDIEFILNEYGIIKEQLKK